MAIKVYHKGSQRLKCDDEKAKINEKRNEVVNLRQKEFNLPHSEITTRCRISKSSAQRIGKQFMESNQPKKEL